MIQELQNKIILSDIIKPKVKLIRKSNLFWGCCPFHKEKTPSFAVNDEKKFYHCFGCGAHGNVFNFLMNIEELDFPTVVQNLCIAYDVPYKGMIKDRHKIQEQQQEILSVLSEAMKLYQEQLKDNEEVQQYLYSRGLTKETIQRFSIGYASQNHVVTVLLQKYTIDILKKSGIVSSGTFDRLRNRIIFPILNEKHQTIAFAGRALGDEQPKYINSSETDIFQKNLTLYNINNISSKTLEIFLVEGYMDVIMMNQCGLSNVVSSMGTSISKGQLFTIFRRTKTLYLVLDGDQAGQIATNRTIDLILDMITPGYRVFIGVLPKSLDPDSFLRNNSPAAFKECFLPLIDFLCKKIVEDLDLKSGDDLAIGFSRIEEQIGKIKNPNIQKSYKMTLNNFIKEQRNTQLYKKNYSNLTKKLNKTISYIPSAEENIIIIILKYKKILQEHIEQLARISFSNIQLENIKNNLILHIENQEEYDKIQQEYLNNSHIKNIMDSSKSFLHREEFCSKYLWDLICMMPINI